MNEVIYSYADGYGGCCKPPEHLGRLQDINRYVELSKHPYTAVITVFLLVAHFWATLPKRKYLRFVFNGGL